MLEIDEGVVGPEPTAQGVATDEFSRPLEQAEKNLERLLRESYTTTGTSEVAGARDDLEVTEPQRVIGVLGRMGHVPAPIDR